MSAIGDYVHYTWRGYKGKGIKYTPFSYNLQSSINKTHQLVYNKLKQMQERKKAQELEEMLNRSVNLFSEFNGQESQEIYDEAWLVYINSALDEIGRDVYTIVQEGIASGQVRNKKSGERLTSTSMGKGSYLAFDPANQQSKIKILIRVIDKRLGDLKKSVKAVELEGFSVEQLQNVLNGLKNDVDRLCQIAEKSETIDYFGRSAKKVDIMNIGSGKYVGKDNLILALRTMVDPKKNAYAAFYEGGGFLDKLDALVQILNAQAVTAEAIGYSLEEGVRGELEFLQEHREKFIEKTVLQNVSSIKRTGSDSSSRALKNSLFSANVNMEAVVNGKDLDSIKNARMINKGKGYTVIADAASNKADLTITYENGHTTSISMKNSNFQVSHYGLSIVGGSPLLYMIQAFNQYDFVNHYLNHLFAITPRRLISEAQRDYVLIRQQMAEILLLVALTQAGGISVEGNIKNNPGLFLFRETFPAAGKEGKYADQFRVITMYDLFGILMQDIDEYIDWENDDGNKIIDRAYQGGQDMIDKFGTPSYGGFIKHSSARITWILMQLRQRKVSVHITRKAVVERLRSSNLKNIPQ